MRTLLFTIILSSSLSAFAQVESKVCNEELLGVWINSDFGYEMLLTINSDGTCVFDGVSLSYVCDARTISFGANGVGETYNYTLGPNELYLSTETGNYVLKKSTTKTNQTTAQTSVKPSSQTKELLGIWVGNNERIEFKDNGTCLVNGQVLSYQTSGNTLVLSSSNGSASMNFSVVSNQLSVQVEGKTVVYTRESSSNNTEVVEKSGTKRIAQELVGKWCWTNVTSTTSGGTSSEKCIALNADGTYSYNSERSMDTNTDAFYAGTSSQSSDFGTWNYDGTRIYYNSQNGQGSGSYLLEKRNHPKNGDPMIVLDGETYVTYYQKNPW